MRILLATDWNRGRGGAEAYALLLRAGLVAAGDEVRLLTSSVGSAGDGRAEYVARGSERLAAQALLQIANPFAIARVRQAVRELRPDVVWINMFAQQLSPVFLHALAGIPIVLSVSDYKCICPNGLKLLPDDTICTRRAGLVCRTSGCVGTAHWLRDQPRYALIRSALGRAAHILACSAWVRSALASDGIASQVILLPVSPPTPGYRRAPAAEPTFLFCGRLDREKGLQLLLRAFAGVRAEVPAARLRVVGAGPLLPELSQLARALDLDRAVVFTGWRDPGDVEAELATAWALVAPSLHAEPLGLVAPEAIVRRVPVVASASGGFAETVIEGRTGLLFPNGDEGALARRMLGIARREVFAAHVPDDASHADALVRHDPGHHIALVRAALRAAIPA